MRELKFRAWDKETEEYLPISNGVSDGVMGITANGQRILYLEDGEINIEYVGHCIIEQYTGLKDKNGKEIYEGDLIKVSDAPAIERKVLVVEFDEYEIGEYTCNKMIGWMVKAIGREWWQSSLADEVDRCEVIGNIHENPELLEDEK